VSTPDNAIAVVGMAGKFPGANDVSEFWSNLRHGKESIVTLSDQELRDAGVSEKTLADPAYVRRAPLLDRIDEFDADFFGLPPQAAKVLDPQHRLFLQCAWHALEDAGCDPARFDGSIGVYGTSSPSGYLLHNLMSHRDPNAVLAEGLNFDQFSLFLQNDKDFLATRISHAFNLRGPSLAVQTACSSSLVAVHLACMSLLSGECDMALAGGSSLCIPHHVGYWNSPGSMVSAVGHCRPFDVRADGTVFGSGVAMVALKPLQAAIDAGDRVHAIIRGSAINNDGSAKMGFAAPNPAAQADVIAEAHAVSGIDSSTVSYVETHGTGTPLGDPIEIQGLRTAFAASKSTRAAPCVLGSVKANIGHLEVAAGIAGLIKTILCLKNKAIPATLHYTSPNPELRLEQTPFVVQSKYGPWESDGVRRAGVSSFGVGGTNAHVVLEEAPAVPAHAGPTGPRVLLLSAKIAAGLDESRAALATVLAGPDGPDLTDVAVTLAQRRMYDITMAAVVHDREQAVKVLRAAEHENVVVGKSAERTQASDRIVFLSPGQGAQHVGIAQGLYDTEPVFAEHFDACAAGFRDEFGPDVGLDLHALVFGGSAATLEHIDRAHPALFAVEYALGKLAAAYGVRAGAFAGHSIGEYVAATLAGVFDLETAIKVVSTRARLLHASPAGAMVAVALGPDALAEHLIPGVDIAVVNDPASCVVAGSDEAIRTFTRRLAEHGTLARRVRVSHAAHSSSMDAVVPEFEAFLSTVQLREPHTPLLSNVTGTWMSAEEATDPARWARQIRATVRFSDEIDAMLTDPNRILVELGPGGSLTGSAVRHPKWSSGHRAVRLMRHPVQNVDDRDAFLLALGQLWSAGVQVDWSPLTGPADNGRPQLVSLPGYPFARQQHWVEPKTHLWNGAATAATAAPGGSTNGSAARLAQGAEPAGTEEVLRRVWSQCLGVRSLDRTDNFFELGGDSLIAIGIVTNAANEGVEITPQDLYEHPTLAGLAAAVDVRYAAGGLAKPPSETANPAVPPTIAHFLEHGVREANSWRIPLILRLDPKVGVDDVRAVLTALTNHHDALRLQLVDHAGTWEQHIAAPGEFGGLLTRSLPDDVAPASPAAREAVSEILVELASGQQAGAPLVAAYISGSGSDFGYLALSVHEMVADNTSREILATDLLTAFTQRLAGTEVVLPPATATWRDWSLRCAALATHPAVLDTSDFWLQSSRATLRLADPEITEPPHRADLTRLSSALTSDQTSQVDDARRRLTASIEEILLAGLSRTIAQTVGEGLVTVDLEGPGRSVLRPDVDLRRTIGRFTTLYPAPLRCARDSDATELLTSVHNTLKSVPHYGIGYGLLRHVYAPTARLFAAQPPADVHFRYAGTIPEVPALDAAVQFDTDATLPVRDPIAGLGHAIEFRVYRHSGVLHLDWWYDTRRIQSARAEALAQRFPLALRVLIQDAIDAIPDEENLSAERMELALVDLSSLDAG
jgi:phthiocerol/phenolphthiocerol synthesis type-I polyketide synthase E